MGGGNAQKSKTARDRNNAKKAKDLKQKNRGETVAQMTKDKEAYKCSICLTTFMCTVKEAQLRDHHEKKHKKLTVLQCFPHLKE